MGALVYAVLLAAYVVFGVPAGPLGEETVVVLPGENGKIGGVVVRRGFQKEVVLDTAYAASHIGVDGTLKPERLSPAQVQREYGKTVEALPLKPATFILYFVTGSDELTQESKSKLDQVFAEIRKRPVPDVLLIGHTDTVGDIESNDILSRQRADKVREILVKAGINADRIEVAGRGERELLVPTGDDVEEPRNRGVEINVR
jgi:outer membrane protein OmpA-like peptidoglycan-associated protein